MINSHACQLETSLNDDIYGSHSCITLRFLKGRALRIQNEYSPKSSLVKMYLK